MKLKRRSRGTPHMEPRDDDFICGFCENSGVAETTGGKLVPCRCGQTTVGDSKINPKTTSYDNTGRRVSRDHDGT